MAPAQLTPLAAVERLSPLCIRVLGGNPGKFTLQGTNTYLVGTGRHRILIDTGEGRPAWIESLRQTLQTEDATVKAALITHWHHDHTGGIDQLLRMAPDAVIYKNNPDPGQLPIYDGQEFSVDGITLTAAHTPGHTQDHVVFVMREEDAMFTADNVLGHGTAVFEDITIYLESLEKMRRLFTGRAYPGHGPVVEDGPAKIAEYVAHRRQREEQVLTTMRSAESPMTRTWQAMELVKFIYSDVPLDLHEAACRGVVQILEKLRAEGKVSSAAAGQWSLLKQSP